jgi:hypothetical protein
MINVPTSSADALEISTLCIFLNVSLV